MSGYRTVGGSAIDRANPIKFHWEGKEYSGFAGDTLASALLANGIKLFGRSFKYHRPRGLLAAGLDEPNAIVQVGEGPLMIPNLKASYVEVYEGLKAMPVNAWPSLSFDLMAINGLFKRFIPAAFYYKTFMWPSWLLFEPAIRHAAGLGRSPDQSDSETYIHTTAHCDVLVVGGGIAGLAAALAQGRLGRRVLIVTGGAHWGGRLAGSNVEVEGLRAGEWIAQTVAELASLPNVRMNARTLATGNYDQGLVALCERLTDHVPVEQRTGPRQRLWRVRAQEIVHATGAFERPLVFSNNDRPGVMLAGAALVYLRRYGVLVGRNIAVATNNDSAWQAAFEISESGATIKAIVDAREVLDVALLSEAASRGISVFAGCAPETVLGSRSVTALKVAALGADDRLRGQSKTIDCEIILMSGGWSPAVHLHSQAGGHLRFDGGQGSFRPLPSECQSSLGSAAGDYSIENSLAAARGQAPVRMDAATIRPLWFVGRTAEPPADAWVDLQNDVTAGDVALASRENFRSVEHLKRYTTLGMASDQGKTSNVNGIGILSRILDKPIPDIGTTKFRPPYDPVTLGVFAGHRIRDGLAPRRLLALDARHRQAHGLMEEYGGWMRAAAYPQEGESEAAAICREVLAVRNSVGLFDASPLGKIEVRGRDAATFLDRIYVNTISNLKSGRCRYGLMLNENGTIFDDGIVTRLAEDHFLVGTTSGHASAIAELLEEWLQCEWVDLEVATMDVTGCWAVLNVAGPAARTLLQALPCDIDLSPARFTHMSHREGHLAGLPVRVARVSFSGELSYEIAVRNRDANLLWNMLLDAGKPHQLTLFGIEALMTMRIEKGFLHVGSETDGTTQPQDVGFGAALANKKSDFIGRRSTSRPDSLRPDRRQLVGIEMIDQRPVHPGAHIVASGKEREIGSDGWITSAAWSPTLGRPVALAMVKAGQTRFGEAVRVSDIGQWREARIVSPCSYDDRAERLDG